MFRYTEREWSRHFHLPHREQIEYKCVRNPAEFGYYIMSFQVTQTQKVGREYPQQINNLIARNQNFVIEFNSNLLTDLIMDLTVYSLTSFRTLSNSKGVLVKTPIIAAQSSKY